MSGGKSRRFFRSTGRDQLCRSLAASHSQLEARVLRVEKEWVAESKVRYAEAQRAEPKKAHTIRLHWKESSATDVWYRTYCARIVEFQTYVSLDVWVGGVQHFLKIYYRPGSGLIEIQDGNSAPVPVMVADDVNVWQRLEMPGPLRLSVRLEG
jgi:hypothetical protein